MKIRNIKGSTLKNLKGFRDFLPAEKRQRDFVLTKIKEIFEIYGFEPLETPTLEYADLLLGKYGSEADKLVYTFTDEGKRKVGLRYDQTVPTARVLAQYQNQLPKFFRRYQIQNVFRAEKPQAGRFREFTQCDIDIFGSTNPLSDAEIITCTYFAFKNVGFPQVIIKVNDRQILFERLSQYVTPQISIFSIIQSVDKLDKLSETEVINELVKKGVTKDVATQILTTIKSSPTSSQLTEIIDLTRQLGVPAENVIFVPTLARGLDYYTGMICEVIVPKYGKISLGGGGRYDKLIEELGGVNVPAVGIAFGFDRMVEVANQLNLIQLDNLGTQLLITVFNKSLLPFSVKLISQLRQRKISSEIYLNPDDKLDKQLKYADKKGIPYVVILGPNEASQNTYILKDMKNKTQQTLTLETLLTKLTIKNQKY